MRLAGHNAFGTLHRAANPADLSAQTKREPRRIFSGGLGGHETLRPLHLSGLFPIPVADLAFLFIEGEVIQAQQRADHVFAHPLGLFLCFGPD